MQAHAEPVREALDRLLGERAVEPHPPAQEAIGVEEAAHEESVGERGVLAAAAVAGRPGTRARALGTHLGHADLVDPGDGAAPRPDGGDAHHRHHHRDTADVFRRAVARAAVLHHRNIRARAAHVERDQVAEAGRGGDVGRPDDPGRRAGQERRHRLRPGRRHRHNAAVGLGHVGDRGHPARGQRRLEALEVPAHLRLHVGVHHRERGALVLARFRPHLVRGGHRHAGRRGLGQGARPALVGRIAVGVDEADHEPLDALRGQPVGGRGHGGLVQRGIDPAVGPEALRDLSDARAGDQRLGTAAVEIERVRQAETLDLEDVPEPLGHQEAEPRAGALDQRVHRDRGAVDHHVDRAGIDALLTREAVEAVLDGPGEVRRRRRHLQAGDVVGLRVVEREIGEGSADVDAEPVTPHLARLSSRTCPPADGAGPSRIAGPGGPGKRSAQGRACIAASASSWSSPLLASTVVP